MIDPAVYFRTVRHLRPLQVWTRVLRRAFRPRVVPSHAPQIRPLRSRPATPLPARQGWLSPRRVLLLNLEKSFENGIDWRPSAMTRLWIYQLNYFDDLPSSADDPDRAWVWSLVGDWIDANPLGTQDTWDPYPTSIRILNWVKGIALVTPPGAKSAAAHDAGVMQRALDSLSMQVRYLAKSLEYDIMANHLFSNAVALTAAGFFFGGAEGDGWLRAGLRLLGREAEEQVLPDGGHFERTPMYHAVVLGQMLDVLNLWEAFSPPSAAFGGSSRDASDSRRFLESKALDMLDWLALVVHPDGELPFFNDTTLGASPTIDELSGYAARIGINHAPREPGTTELLRASGFVRATSPDGRTFVLLDAGGPSPAYQPGHAHSEALSIELSRDGRRVIVNSGVSTYGTGPERLRQRRTASHSTVRIDGKEQSELWASHRCGRRCRCSAGITGGAPWGEHDGYSLLPGRPIHRRALFVEDGTVALEDLVTGGGEHLLEVFFHLHPDVAARVDGNAVSLKLDGRAVGSIAFETACDVAIEDGFWHPGFNLSCRNAVIVARCVTGLPVTLRTVIEWT